MLADERSTEAVPLPARTAAFRRVVTARLDNALAPALLPVLFLLATAALAALGGIAVVAAWVVSWWLGALATVAVPLLVFTMIVVVRVACEIALGVSLLTAQSMEMASGLSRMESTVTAMARDMPPLGFLRRPGPYAPVGTAVPPPD